MIKFLLFVIVTFAYGHKLQLQKPKVYTDQNITGWLMSEKLDGIRGYWNGKEMLSKSGYPINTSANFIKHFPPFPLDGEIWYKRASFEKIQSIALDTHPTKGWEKLTYNIFEVPYAEGNFTLRLQKAKSWFKKHPNKHINFIKQHYCHNKEELMHFLKRIETLGGEGVVVKNPTLDYFSGRSSSILKVKSFRDDEATVKGYNPGKGKYHGMMGSLHVQLKNGVEFNLGGGFTVEERLSPPAIGSLITFKYFGWTKNHKPKFASFMRERSQKTVEKYYK